ncbi:MAG: hypothetical protein II532_02475, partial [Bacteroidales bacterium]|nr:hypothetical protein [Bacteroidales bacterium]
IASWAAAMEKLDPESPEAKAYKEAIGKEKTKLAAVTWQAYFPNGRRKNTEAVPSGLYMLDIDHVENPAKLYNDIIGKRQECDIVYIGMTPSTHGLRVVAECRPEFTTLAECQRWLAERLGVEADEVCKDFARCSFMVPDNYIYYMDMGIFDREPKCVYRVEGSSAMPKRKNDKTSEPLPEQQYSDLFGELQKEYDGIAIEDICKVYLQQNGGEPKEGERNAKLYKLALRLRYICDFNEYVLLQNMPRYGLDEEEMKTLIHSANNTNRGQQMPADLKVVINTLKAAKSLKENTEEVVDMEDYSDITDTTKVPSLPPVFKEWYNTAPDDFKVPTIACLLPVLGALGSKLRALYFDGTMQSPTFQVSLEAPQASGKSFMRRLSDYCLASMIEHDNAQRQLEKEFNDKRAELKVLNIKVTQKNKEEVLGNKPEVLIRYLPATVSITKFLMRMDQAKGLHCFALAEEIDTVYKAYKKSFSSLSDILRCSFDNVSYGQDYATDTSYSGMVQLYYNTLFSGTPKAMRRFYPDVEDGLVSRVMFVTLPDQFGKPYARWREFSEEQKKTVDIGLLRLNEVSIQGDEVQPDHVMQMPFLATAMQEWCLKQQQMAVLTHDKTRDTFCRRSAVVGFRAGMIAYYLWNEKPIMRKRVVAFSTWIANMMLNQHMLRFDLNTNDSNTTPYKRVFDRLPEVFNMNDVISLCNIEKVDSPPRQLVYKWKLAGLISKTDNNVYKKEAK